MVDIAASSSESAVSMSPMSESRRKFSDTGDIRTEVAYRLASKRDAGNSNGLKDEEAIEG
jgi:hypothetical protein